MKKFKILKFDVVSFMCLTDYVLEYVKLTNESYVGLLPSEIKLKKERRAELSGLITVTVLHSFGYALSPSESVDERGQYVRVKKWKR